MEYGEGGSGLRVDTGETAKGERWHCGGPEMKVCQVKGNRDRMGRHKGAGRRGFT